MKTHVILAVILGLGLGAVQPARATSLTGVAAATTIAINVLEAPATWRKARAAVKKLRRHHGPSTNKSGN